MRSLDIRIAVPVFATHPRGCRMSVRPGCSRAFTTRRVFASCTPASAANPAPSCFGRMSEVLRALPATVSASSCQSPGGQSPIVGTSAWVERMTMAPRRSRDNADLRARVHLQSLSDCLPSRLGLRGILGGALEHLPGGTLLLRLALSLSSRSDQFKISEMGHSFQAMGCELALEAMESAARGRSQGAWRSPGAGLPEPAVTLQGTVSTGTRHVEEPWRAGRTTPLSRSRPRW
jgi:hypothetical protein